jgi:hypothetical protein
MQVKQAHVSLMCFDLLGSVSQFMALGNFYDSTSKQRTILVWSALSSTIVLT